LVFIIVYSSLAHLDSSTAITATVVR
jgi:hypothetical protein